MAKRILDLASSDIETMNKEEILQSIRGGGGKNY